MPHEDGYKALFLLWYLLSEGSKQQLETEQRQWPRGFERTEQGLWNTESVQTVFSCQCVSLMCYCLLAWRVCSRGPGMRVYHKTRAGGRKWAGWLCLLVSSSFSCLSLLESQEMDRVGGEEEGRERVVRDSEPRRGRRLFNTPLTVNPTLLSIY